MSITHSAQLNRERDTYNRELILKVQRLELYYMLELYHVYCIVPTSTWPRDKGDWNGLCSRNVWAREVFILGNLNSECCWSLALCFLSNKRWYWYPMKRCAQKRLHFETWNGLNKRNPKDCVKPRTAVSGARVRRKTFCPQSFQPPPPPPPERFWSERLQSSWRIQLLKHRTLTWSSISHRPTLIPFLDLFPPILIIERSRCLSNFHFHILIKGPNNSFRQIYLSLFAIFSRWSCVRLNYIDNFSILQLALTFLIFNATIGMLIRQHSIYENL